MIRVAAVSDLHFTPDLIGTARAKELILLGEPIGAREAERYGLVNRVVPAVDFAAALDDTVARPRVADHQRAGQQAPHDAHLRHRLRHVPCRDAGILRALPGVRGASAGHGRPPQPLRRLTARRPRSGTRLAVYQLTG